MNRSNYSEDLDAGTLNCWRGAVASACRGKRGQAFLKELVETLDAMPVKKLIQGELVEDGQYCALGAVGAARGLKMKHVDVTDSDYIASMFGISDALVREIEFVNDDAWIGEIGADRDAHRWKIVRNWAASQIQSSDQKGDV